MRLPNSASTFSFGRAASHERRAEQVELVDDRPAGAEHSSRWVCWILDFQNHDAILPAGAAKVAAEHLAERRIVVEREARAMRTDQRLAIANEVDQARASDRR